MSNKELMPLEQAKLELPQPWYNKLASWNKLGALTVLITVLTTYPALKYFDNLPIHLAGGSIYLLSIITDDYSTNKVLDAINEARRNGVETSYQEKNPLLSKITASHEYKEYNSSVKGLAINIAWISVAAVLPPVGMALGIAKGVASASNIYVAKLHNRATEIAKKRNPQNL